ncbi:MAG: 3-oxoacyl-ACP reductase [Myxococcota bacterium]
MNDLLLDISGNPQARKLVKSLGLPIPLPENLARARGPWQERPLDDAQVVVGTAPGAELVDVLAQTVVGTGAFPHVVGDRSVVQAFEGPGEAWGRLPKAHAAEEVPEGLTADALVFDATSITDPAGLRALYDFFHPWIKSVGKSGRAVVLGRPPETREDPAAAAASAALEGFVRSLAKELGRKGATAQLLYVEPGAEDRVEPVLRWVLSPRSAFVTGQPIRITSQAKAADDRPKIRPLHGKVVLVTGAARGIGAATAELMAAEGAHVVCLDRPADDGPASQVARDIGGSVLLADVSDPDAAQQIAEELENRHGGVDVVVHNAGVTRDRTLAKMKPELWDQAVDINLAAVVRITQHLLDRKVLRDGGRVVCLSSVAGIAGNMGQSNYAASKRGIIGFIEHLAPVVAGRGITVNAIAPGFIETRLTAVMPVGIREAARRLSALGQGGQPQDVGEAITFLSTPGADGVTGRVLRVCGGAFVGA